MLDAVIQLILEQHQHLLRTGAVLVDPADAGTEPRYLFFLEQTVRDATERVISREVHFVEIGASGEIRVGGGAPYLDYRPATDDERNASAPQGGTEGWNPAVTTPSPSWCRAT